MTNTNWRTEFDKLPDVFYTDDYSDEALRIGGGEKIRDFIQSTLDKCLKDQKAELLEARKEGERSMGEKIRGEVKLRNWDSWRDEDNKAYWDAYTDGANKMCTELIKFIDELVINKK